jgi:hypothetical protein
MTFCVRDGKAKHSRRKVGNVETLDRISRNALSPVTPITTVTLMASNASSGPGDMHAYEVRPRKDHRGVDLISDALPFGGLWYGGPNAVRQCNRVC